MKIVWLVNIIMPDFAKALGLSSTNAGGWLTGQLETLQAQPGLQLSIWCVSNRVQKTESRQCGKVRYTAFAPAEFEAIQAAFCTQLAAEAPDIVHIFGSESPNSLALAKAAGFENCLVTIQGVLYAYEPHFYDAMPTKYRKKPYFKLAGKRLLAAVGLTPNLLYCHDQEFLQNAEKEKQLLQNAVHFTGRTAWDKACVLEQNPKACYNTLCENLRPEFYTGEQWKYETCQKHSIFVSQADYPIKGFHQLLKAAKVLVQSYPDLHIYVGGSPRVTSSNPVVQAAVDVFFEYQTYLYKLIAQYGLAQNVTFCGPLNAESMKQHYLAANVFVSPSAIENSPNSVGEAMLLACPVVSSNVGGVSSLLVDKKEGLLYDFFDTDTLEKYITMFFDDPTAAAQAGHCARQHALQTHDRENNTHILLGIYQQMAGQ